MQIMWLTIHLASIAYIAFSSLYWIREAARMRTSVRSLIRELGAHEVNGRELTSERDKARADHAALRLNAEAEIARLKAEQVELFAGADNYAREVEELTKERDGAAKEAIHYKDDNTRLRANIANAERALRP